MRLTAINIERLIHSIKTVIACLLGLLFTKLIGLPAEQWVIITILVVMCAQIYVGSVLRSAYLRFLGTLIGCLFAAFIIITLGDAPTSTVIAIAASSFVFSYIATKQENLTYAATLGAVTTAIILLDPHPTLSLAFQRFLEISLGVFIATMVSQFVLPIHATVHLRRAQAATLGQLSHYYQEVMINRAGKETPPDYQELEEEIVTSLLKQRQLAKESSREHLGGVFNTEHFMLSLYAEREILRAITFMQHALAHSPEACALFIQSQAVHVFNNHVVETLKKLIAALDAEEDTATATLPSVKRIREDIQQRASTLAPEEKVYLDGFLFSAKILSSSLGQLATLYRVAIKEE